jgi:hypothetical protein
LILPLSITDRPESIAYHPGSQSKEDIYNITLVLTKAGISILLFVSYT